jgi:hypothetical protein
MNENVGDHIDQIDYGEDEIFGASDIELGSTPVVDVSEPSTPKTPKTPSKKRKRKKKPTTVSKIRDKARSDSKKKRNTVQKPSPVSLTKIELPDVNIQESCRKYYNGFFKGGAVMYPPTKDLKGDALITVQESEKFVASLNEIRKKAKRKDMSDPVHEFMQILFGTALITTFTSWMVGIRRIYTSMPDTEKKKLGEFVPPNIYKEDMSRDMHEWQRFFNGVFLSALHTKRAASIFLFNAFIRVSIGDKKRVLRL